MLIYNLSIAVVIVRWKGVATSISSVLVIFKSRSSKIFLQQQNAGRSNIINSKYVLFIIITIVWNFLSKN